MEVAVGGGGCGGGSSGQPVTFSRIASDGLFFGSKDDGASARVSRSMSPMRSACTTRLT